MTHISTLIVQEQIKAAIPREFASFSSKHRHNFTGTFSIRISLKMYNSHLSMENLHQLSSLWQCIFQLYTAQSHCMAHLGYQLILVLKLCSLVSYRKHNCQKAVLVAVCGERCFSVAWKF